MRDPLPLVFIHRRNSPYLACTLAQAKAWSPASPVFLIGDSTNDVYPFVTHVDMARYANRFDEFAKIYRHLSPNGHAYEMFCFVRWFLLRDFMREHALENIMHVDSDVLLYVDVNRERDNWRDYGLTLVRELCPGNMFVNGRRHIERLCEITRDLYAGPDSAARLDAIYEKRKLTSEGISDMVPFKILGDEDRGTVGEMTGVRPDGSYWDANIHLPEGFETADGRKRIHFIDGVPHARHIATARDVRFNCLHFQGAAKPHIEPAYRQSARRFDAAA